MGSRRCILLPPLRHNRLLRQRLRWLKETLWDRTTCRGRMRSGPPTAQPRTQTMTTAAWHPSSLSCPTTSSSSPSLSPSGDASRWSKNMNERSFSDLEGCVVEARKAQASSLFSPAFTPTGVLIYERVLLMCRPRRSTRDSVTVSVDAVVYYQVSNP